MAYRAAAKRYARALFDVCEREGALEHVERDVAGFMALLDGHAMLRKCLLSPVVPPASKRAVVAALVERGGELSPITGRLLALLAERNRLALLPELLEVYREGLMAHRGQLRAQLTTTTALDGERTREIARRIEGATGRDVTVEARVNPSLIGGAMVQIGSTVWDGSVARHLARLRQRLLADA